MNIKNLLLFFGLISAIFVLRQVDYKLSTQDLINSFKLKNSQRQLSSVPVSVLGKYCNADLVNEITQSQIDEQKRIFEQLNKQRGGSGSENLLGKTLKNGDYTGYGLGLLGFYAPWLILAVISLFGWGCYCLCCICDSCCPPSKCCRRTKPYTPCEMSWPNFGQMIFGTLIIAFGIVSFAYNTKLEKGLNSLRCNTISIVDHLIFGKVSSNATWIGIYPVQGKLSEIKTQVSNSTNEFTNAFKNTDWLDTDSKDLTKQVSDIYINHKDKKVTSPQSASLNVDSFFIQNLLGPLDKSNTMTNILNQEFQAKTQAFVDIAKQLKTASSDMTRQTDTIVTALDDGIKQVSTYTSTMTDLYNSIVDAIKQTDNIFPIIINFFYGFWGAALFAAVLSIIGALLVQCLKKEGCRFLLHISWCIACILMIIGFLLSAVVFPTTIAMFDFCNLYDGMLKDFNEFSSYDKIMSEDVTKNLKTCLFPSVENGNGDISKQFGMQSALQTVNAVDEQFKKLSNYTSRSDGFSATQTTVTYWINFVEGYRIGSTLDGTGTGDDNANIVLVKLNQNTDSEAQQSTQSGCSSKTFDNWVYQDAGSNCTGRNKVLNSSTTASLGTKSCLEIGYFNTADVSTRYTSQPSGCPAVTTDINRIYANLKNYDNSRRNLFENIKNDLITLNKANTQLITKLTQFQQNLTTLQINVQKLLSNIGDPKLGLANSFNCKFLGEDMDSFIKGMCIAFLVPMYYMLVFIVVGSILMLFNSCFAYTAAMRHSKKNTNQIQKQTFNPGSENEMQKFNV